MIQWLRLHAPNAGHLGCDAITPIVQDLPTTEDGKIYIYLGIAYDATHIELFEQHPVYYYKDGAIRLWTNAAQSTTEFVISANVWTIKNTGYITCDKTPTEAIQAIQENKNVSMNILDQYGGMLAYRVKPLYEPNLGRITFAYGINSLTWQSYYIVGFASSDVGYWEYQNHNVTLDLAHSAVWSDYDVPLCKTLKFNYADAMPSWDTIEQMYDLGSTFEQLVLAACTASGSGKVTLGTDVSALGSFGWETAYNIYRSMTYGQGSVIYTTDDNGHHHAFRVVSADKDVVDNEYAAYAIAYEGRAYHDYSSNKSYNITAEFGAKRTDLGNDEYDYEAYAAVTAEEINITFV